MGRRCNSVSSNSAGTLRAANNANPPSSRPATISPSVSGTSLLTPSTSFEVLIGNSTWFRKPNAGTTSDQIHHNPINNAIV